MSSISDRFMRSEGRATGVQRNFFGGERGGNRQLRTLMRRRGGGRETERYQNM